MSLREKKTINEKAKSRTNEEKKAYFIGNICSNRRPFKSTLYTRLERLQKKCIRSIAIGVDCRTLNAMPQYLEYGSITFRFMISRLLITVTNKINFM